MKSNKKIYGGFLAFMFFFLINVSYGQQAQLSEEGNSKTTKWKEDFESFCAQTQSDDCITIDSNGFWWDSEPSLKPVWTKMKALSVITTSNSKVVKLGDRFFCSKRNSGKGYLRCTIRGWQYTLYYRNHKGDFVHVRETLYYQKDRDEFVRIYNPIYNP